MKRGICGLLTCALLMQSLPLAAGNDDTRFATLVEAARSGAWVEVVYVRESRRMERSGFVVRIRDEFVYISRGVRGRREKIPIEDVLSVNVGCSKVIRGAKVRVTAPSISQKPISGVVTAITFYLLTIRSEKDLYLNAVREKGRLPRFVTVPASELVRIPLESVQKLEVLAGKDEWDRVPIEHIRIQDSVLVRDVWRVAGADPPDGSDLDMTYDSMIRVQLDTGRHITGRIVRGGSDSTIVIAEGNTGERVTVPLWSIAGIEVQRKRRRIVKSALAGSAAGAVIGWVAGKNVEHDVHGEVPPAMALFCGGVCLVVGALVGLKSSTKWEATTLEELRLELERENRQ